MLLRSVRTSHVTGCDSTSFICKHSKKPVRPHFVFPPLSTSLNVLRANTIAPADRFFCPLCMTDPSDQLDLARSLIFVKFSNPEKLRALCDAFKWHLRDATSKPRFDAKHRFQKRSFRTLRRQDERWRWGSTGLYFYDPRSNLRGLSGVSFKLVRHWLWCKCLLCALGCVDVLRPTLTAASTGTRLCEKHKRC